MAAWLPFDANARRQTSFASLEVMPELDNTIQVNIRPEDIDIVPVEQGQLTGTVTSVTFKGMQYDIIVAEPGTQLRWMAELGAWFEKTHRRNGD